MFKLIILCFISFCVIMGIVKRICRNFRKKLVILVDIDALFEMSAVLQRAEIYAQNKADSNLLDYMKDHFREIGVCPNGLKKALIFQQKGYTLKFISNLDENLRIVVARLLNIWGLEGELFLSADEKLIVKIEPNIIGIISNNKNLTDERLERLGIKAF